MFWNLKGKNLLGPLIELILENDIDILALSECKALDCQALINSLRIKGKEWKRVEFCSEGDIKVLAKYSVQIIPYMEEERHSIYKIGEKENIQLLMVLHLSSALHLEENARDRKAENMSRILRKIEKEFYVSDQFKSIIVGDFNLQSYAESIIGAYGFNATKSITKALQITRNIDKQEKYFYFNPMWKLMGENKLVQGTYYNSSDSQIKSIYWYVFDEVLIRPYFIDKFNWNYFNIVEKTNSYDFVPNSIIDKERYSDHLPLKFEIKEE